MLTNLKTALITGASRGIGAAFARRLAARGKDLVLVARSEPELQALAEDLAARHGIQTRVIAADLACPSAAAAIFAETERLGLEVDLLVNNAGFARVGAFAEVPLDVWTRMVCLNVSTLMELTRLYLPAMRRRRRGGIINVASNAAFQPVPYLSVYAATKAFVLHFSEGLAHEVEADGVRVLALCPGATATEFWSVAGALEGQTGLMTSPDKVVDVALRTFEGRGAFVVPGLGYKLLAFAAGRLAPRWLVPLIAGWFFRRVNGS